MRGRAADAVLRRELQIAGAGLLASIDVVVARNAELTRRADEGFGQFVTGADVRNSEWSVTAVIFAFAALVRFRFPEVRKHLVPAPSRIAQRGPAIVILRLAADVDETVDRARSAERASARIVDRTVLHPGLRLGLKPPVVHRVKHGLAVADRDVQPQVAIGRTRFEEHDRMPSVCRQPVGEHAPGRSRTDDHVVVHARFDHLMISNPSVRHSSESIGVTRSITARSPTGVCSRRAKQRPRRVATPRAPG